MQKQRVNQGIGGNRKKSEFIAGGSERFAKRPRQNFQKPPIRWIEAKLENLKALLEKNLVKSNAVLRELLGPVTLQAVYPDIAKPYYMAQSSIDTMALIEMPSSKDGTEDGSTTLRWWIKKETIYGYAWLP